MMGLLERMEINTVLEGGVREGDIYIEIMGDKEGMLIGKHSMVEPWNPFSFSLTEWSISS